MEMEGYQNGDADDAEIDREAEPGEKRYGKARGKVSTSKIRSRRMSDCQHRIGCRKWRVLLGQMSSVEP